MKIVKLRIKDFQGLEGDRTYEFGHINIFCGPNREGKSSLLNALKYSLTGVEPEGEPVHKGKSKTTVNLVMENGDIIRQRMAGSKSTTHFLEWKKSTKKAVDQTISENSGVPLEAIRVASSEDVLKTLKPQEFGQLILSYTEDKMDLPVLEGMMPSETEFMKKILEERLPSEFGVSELNEFHKNINEDRLKQKRALDAMEKTIEVLREREKPKMTKEQLLEKEKEIAENVAEAKAYKEKLAAYNKAKEALQTQEKTIANYKEQIAQIKAEKKSEEERKALQKEEENNRETMLQASAALHSFETSSESTKKIIENLNTTICPLSDKLVCTTDKTKVREELNANIKTMEKGIKEQKKAIQTLTENNKVLSEKIRLFDKEQEEYRRKEFLEKEMAKIEESKIKLPPEPVKPNMDKADVWITQIRNLIAVCNDYERADAMEEKVKRGKIILGDLELLTKYFAPKGPVMEKITEKYMRAFEEECNRKAAELHPGMKVRFISDNGVHVLVDVNGSDEYLPYDSLSGAEKALYIYLMLDLLNTLSGLRILIVDELSVLDKDSFRALIKLIVEHQDDYDHIFLAMVNHEDTLAVLDEFGLTPYKF